MWKKFRKLKKPRNILFAGIVCFLIFITYLYSHLHSNVGGIAFSDMKRYATPVPECFRDRNFQSSEKFHKSSKFTSTRQKALVFLESSRSQVSKEIITMLESVRFKFHVVYGELKKLPNLTDDDKGKYAVIIFETMTMYNLMAKWNKEVLDKYCRDYEAGLLFFLKPQKTKGYNLENLETFSKVKGLPLFYLSGVNIRDYELNTTSPVLRITKPGKVWEGDLSYPHEWTVFQLGHPTYAAVSWAKLVNGSKHSKNRPQRKSSRNLFGVFTDNSLPQDAADEDGVAADASEEKFPVIVHDRGLLDGIQKIIVGAGFRFWLHKVLFMDALSYLSHGKLATPLERYVQVDIDDMFVGPVGARMNKQDVDALVKFQQEVRRDFIPNFTFQLGFSGKFIFKGTNEENEGDQRLLDLHHHFAWFPHMWSHMQAHWFKTTESLCTYMDENYRFAIRHHFNFSSRYAVAPHHAGVFPVHEQLYTCWQQIWNITTTSTEEYPHLRPDHKRRGFVYRGVKVLPRQTCGLYTHTLKLGLYPNGPQVLHEMIQGGSLFQSLLFNKFAIYMTHLSNYGNDRLAIYTFERLFNFVKCWTNLRMIQEKPEVMARKYFETFPEDQEPVWLNPCIDKRHKEIWSTEKSCSKLPSFIIAGPQKSGTTALHYFLKLHPNLVASLPSPKTFEEIQFFNDVNYFKGLDWYMDFFPQPGNDTLLYEKSATYFDQIQAPKRAHALLPDNYIVVVLIDPAKRAYSWYQHMRAHADPTALEFTFYDVIRSRRKNSLITGLQRRCLDPGFYTDHLERWLEYYPPNQLIILDGDELVKNPFSTLHFLQKSMNFKRYFDYSNALVYDEKKGFYCQMLPNGKSQCLGKGKGRIYPNMDDKSDMFLAKYYADSNKRLKRLLVELRKPVPAWLHNRVGRT